MKKVSDGTRLKALVLAGWAAVMAGAFVLAAGQVGCSTVRGFANDLGDASDGIRKAMTE